ncbi:hypothetical protein TNCV_4413431 [Trichonephila clavipes]|nr:hypothetical protein TNCV_4413431 [Trichonephila clavipes]
MAPLSCRTSTSASHQRKMTQGQLLKRLDNFLVRQWQAVVGSRRERNGAEDVPYATVVRRYSFIGSVGESSREFFASLRLPCEL